MTQLPSDASEAARRRALADFHILDTPPEARFDDLATLAGIICGAPLAGISFFDGRRQWFKAITGAQIEEAPMEHSFCTYTALDPSRPLAVADAREDSRFASAPHVVGVPHLRAYAGAAIVDEDQVPLGTICVFDVAPREFSQAQLDALQALSRQVMSLLELRGQLHELERQRTELLALNAELDQFGFIVAHDLRAPLRQQAAFLQIIHEDFAEALPAGSTTLLTKVRDLGQRAEEIVEEVGSYLRTSSLAGEAIEMQALSEVFASAVALVDVPAAAEVELLAPETSSLPVPKAPIRHILANLLGNALKYSDKERPRVQVIAAAEGGRLLIEVCDNGPGVDPSERTSIFQVFGRGREANRAPGRGLGLAICYRLVLSLRGTILVDEAPGGGACFRVSIPLQDGWRAGRAA